MSRYLIGIDLGTTNTVVYYMDKTVDEESMKPEIFRAPQHIAAGETDEKDTLPSFLYLPDDNEVPEGSLSLPWNDGQDFTIGEMAKQNAPSLPRKVISSSKSWLCSENVDRTAPILPWNRQNPEKQLSPVEASRRILEHVKNAWNHEMAAEDETLRMENQTVILTVPASFDAVARELTVKAAEEAGLNVVLLEEPLAAFYAWLNEKEDSWRDMLQPDDMVLVCDMGGGTTDFSLIKTVDNAGNLEFERVAVGNHILLGGDNMDLTVAYSVAAKLKAEKNMTLDQYQITGLTHACRLAKETLMASEDAPPQKLTVLGRGSGVIGGTITTEISREELEQVLLDGFFPDCALEDAPQKTIRAGLRSFGLNYESDPAITKHLASFLASQCDSETKFPNCVLFNGGVSKATAVQKRITDALRRWSSEEISEIKELSGSNPDLAVAMGGCLYAQVREGKGIRVKAGSPCSYYVGVESSMPAVPGFTPPIQALCAVCFGMEEGTGTDIPFTGLGLLVGETTEFRFFASHERKDDAPGQLIEDAGAQQDLEELPVLSATLPAEKDIPPGTLVPVTLRSELTETGTMQIWCVGENDRRWKLEFELRVEG